MRIPLLVKLENAVNIHKESDVICIGWAFNTVLSNLLDKQGRNNKRAPSQVHLNNLISNISFVDTWRNENPTQKLSRGHRHYLQ